jgi:phenylacetate-CoA ligase
LNDFQPEFIQGYPSALYSISRYIVETGKKLRFKVKAIFSASETLLDFQKGVIEKAFDSKIFQWYGNTEYTSNIVECPEHHFHIKEEYGLIEFKNQKGEPALPGELAEMICTGFGNYAMPFIRYRIGDYAILSSKRCSCGRGGRIVEKIIGRNEDIILTPNRTQVGRLDFVFKQLEGIKEAQIYQDEIDHLQIRIVPEDHYDKKIEKKICSNLDSRLSGMKYDFQYLTKIPRENNGKYRYVISDVYRKKNW